MTYEEYMARARTEAFRRLHAYDRQVGRIYLDLAAKVKAELRDARGLSRFHLEDVLRQLVREADRASRGFRGLIDRALLEAADIQTDYAKRGVSEFWEVLREAVPDVPSVERFYYRIPQGAVRLLYARTYEDGLYLSDRIWRVGQSARSGISRIVVEGFTRGLHFDDPRIAEQLDRFLQPARMGKKLEPTVTRRLSDGRTFTYRQRPVSYDAARLLRNEYMESFKLAQHETAVRNPACYGEQWLLSMEHPDIGCSCEDYATHDEGMGEGVFPLGEIPSTPHTGCLCTWQQVVVSMDTFADWVDEYSRTGGGQIADWWERNWTEMAA